MDQTYRPNIELTQEYVKEIYDYDSETGNLVFKKRTAHKNWIGKIAGTKASDGSIVIGIGYLVYRAHRIIWLWNYGHPIPMVIDHIDGNPCNNRLNNLRSANDSQNVANGKMRSNNASGVKGVYWNKRNKTWDAYVMHNYKKYHLGCFTSIDDAKLARQQKFQELFGEFARHE